MKKSVLVILATKNYLDQAKQMFSAAYWKAGWKGDYLLLAHEIDPIDVTWFINKGIIVKHSKALEKSESAMIGVICLSKFYMLTEYFEQWDHIVYLDTDIIIKGSIDGLLNVEGFGACQSLGQTVRDELLNLNRMDKISLKNFELEYSLDANAFNAGVMSFNTNIINDDLFDVLLGLYRLHQDIALYHDQTIFNLYFCNKWQELPVAYNRTIEKSEYDRVDPDTMDGVIIHTVSLGEGPWDPQNIFYKEWKENFDRADDIDLSNIPEVEPLSEQEVLKQSERIVRNHFLGDELSFANLGRFFKRGFRLVFRDPGRALVKIKQMVQMIRK